MTRSVEFLPERPSDPGVALVGIVFGVLVGYVAALLASVIEPVSGGVGDRVTWTFVIVAIFSVALLWRRPDRLAALARGSFMLASALVVLAVTYLTIGTARVGTGGLLEPLLVSVRPEWSLIAAIGMALAGRYFARQRDADEDREPA